MTLYELREVQGQKGATGNWFKGECEAESAAQALSDFMMDFEGEIHTDGDRAYANCPDMVGTWIHMYQAYPAKGAGGSDKMVLKK